VRLLVSAYACEPNKGSESGNGWNWAHGLAKRGHEVYLLTRPHGRDAINNELSARPMSTLHVTYVDVPRWSKRYFRGQSGVYAHYFLWQRTALDVAKRLQPHLDLVHHVTWGSLHAGSHLWKLGLPFVFGPVGGGQVAPPAFREFFGNGWGKEWLRTLLTRFLIFSRFHRRMLSNSILVLATNEETVMMANRLGAPRVNFFLDTGLPEGFYPPESPVRQPSAELRVLWIGRLYPRKALPLAFMAIERAVAMGVPAHLTVVGDGPLGLKVPTWIRHYSLEGRVDWWGQVPWRRVRDAYASHDVFLFTSLRDSCPAQLLEAMAFGLPIITLSHQGARGLVPNQAGLKVPVTNPDQVAEELAKGLHLLWKEPRKAELMGRAGLEFARQQAWPLRIVRMERLYESVLGSCSVGSSGPDA